MAILSQVMARQVGDEKVNLDLACGTYFGPDRVEARIWALMGEGATLAEICATMLEECEVERGQLEADVLRLAAELAERALIAQA